VRDKNDVSIIRSLRSSRSPRFCNSLVAALVLQALRGKKINIKSEFKRWQRTKIKYEIKNGNNF
jgi:hypothetical protein